MASDRVAPESLAFTQLEQLVRGLGEELANFRRRALQAEARVRTLEESMARGGDADTLERLERLEAENADFRARLEFAGQHVRTLANRAKFVRQQGPAAGNA